MCFNVQSPRYLHLPAESVQQPTATKSKRPLSPHLPRAPDYVVPPSLLLIRPLHEQIQLPSPGANPPTLTAPLLCRSTRLGGMEGRMNGWRGQCRTYSNRSARLGLPGPPCATAPCGSPVLPAVLLVRGPQPPAA